MKFVREHVRKCLKELDFQKLFREHLGWDNCANALTLAVEGQPFSLKAVAEKRGFVAFVCEKLPDRTTRMRLDREVAKSAQEHLVIYVDRAAGDQLWHWVRREPGKPLAGRDHRVARGATGESLVQRLERLAVSVDEEEELTVGRVAASARAAFDVETVTKRFFKGFEEQHGAFHDFIKGIKAQGDRAWYASLMLNRMMFVYFIQKKGFLDGDASYLQNRLQRVRETAGKGKFHSFYRTFLLKLFHDGLGKHKDDRRFDKKLAELIGEVPYLNGGFFELHPIEERNDKIDIPDEAFEKLFAFFEQWNWHLDERPNRAGNEINPDVVGYIFEKFINQKQMGAYYTKEDITEYIGKNTILPWLFDAAKKKCPVAFQPEGRLWRLLADDPDRYLYAAVKKGVINDQGQVVPLPDKIAAGVDDVAKRDGWNRPADAEFALPTETWREHVARRTRCLEVRDKLRRGEVHEIDDLVTLNLDIWQFARDAIIEAEGPDLLRAFWQALAGRVPDKSTDKTEAGVTVLDPTCGSGAFLFAALRILETLYSDCLARMRTLIEDDEIAAEMSPLAQIEALVAGGETKHCEFKACAYKHPRESAPNEALLEDIARGIAAFLNGDGGDLLIGVDNGGTIVGVADDVAHVPGKRKDVDSYLLWMRQRFEAILGKAVVAGLGLVAIDVAGKTVIRATLPPSPEAVYVKENGKSVLYVRAAGGKSKLDDVEQAARYLKRTFPRASESAPKRPERRAAKGGTPKFNDFRTLLAEMDRHANERYFILKSIIVHNLYGVDIMEEAVEICKLRLFLKLVAQVEQASEIEPLPDIDFNIRCGNTLVGYASLDQIKTQAKGRFDFRGDERAAILEEAEAAEKAFGQFRRSQTKDQGRVTAEDKLAVRTRLKALAEKLDVFLAGDYGIAPEKKRAYADWKTSHQPFHWATEFFGIMSRGGFDVVIGNPPYVEYSKVRQQYTIRGFATESSGNLYGIAIERSYQIQRDASRFGFIVQSPVVSTQRMASVREVVATHSRCVWYSTFDDRPSKLFDGMHHCRLAIILAKISTSASPSTPCFTTRYHKWYTEERETLFTKIEYTRVALNDLRAIIPKCGSSQYARLFETMTGNRDYLSTLISVSPTANRVYYKITGVGHWFTFTLEPPKFWRDGREESSTREGILSFRNRRTRDFAFCYLSSTLHYWYYQTRTNCRDVNPSDIESLPLPKNLDDACESMRRLAATIWRNLHASASVGRATYAVGGEVAYQRFAPRATKAFLDQVDQVLVNAFGFSCDDLDAITNYDIKYRMGQDGGDDD